MHLMVEQTILRSGLLISLYYQPILTHHRYFSICTLSGMCRCESVFGSGCSFCPQTVLFASLTCL